MDLYYLPVIKATGQSRSNDCGIIFFKQDACVDCLTRKSKRTLEINICGLRQGLTL